MSQEAGESNHGDLILGRLGAQMEDVVEKLGRIEGKVDTLSEKVINLEAADSKTKIASLELKVQLLETANAQRLAVSQAAGKLPQYVQWAAIFILAIVALGGHADALSHIVK